MKAYKTHTQKIHKIVDVNIFSTTYLSIMPTAHKTKPHGNFNKE